ncbi:MULTISPECIES: THxN family PEP-CTERM protein [unclassified Cyanobium]|uniref:THxN family PEP-CTERM protein n=1 Tax=unclassified Cyanobium TaxID=2627006 RepID=UPI0020CDDC7D|nr:MULTISPECIES: THxN family PEP-CTERM protein [unclassified Cyanobium]MCP9835588.1 THxN family PEP-CTERM protein [Cyanobium sp. La Preciosa 7G6]MCP9938331.1 THxN family PEP-CTERM protein [Cyanobium sp. Aljojuca 7A6]
MAVSAGSALAVGLAPAPVQAQVVLDKTTGSWSNPVGPTTAINTVEYQTVAGQNQIRWGSPTNVNSKSGLGFTGEDYNPNLTILPGTTDFLIGTLQHFNNPISAGTALTSAQLTIDTLFENTNPLSIDFIYTTSIDETPNSTPCAYPSTPGNPCADKISISTIPAQTFTFEGRQLTLASFFLDSNKNPTNSLISQEGGTTTAELWGRLTDPGDNPVTGPGDAVPGPLPVLGIAAAFGYSRKLRKRIQGN